MLKKPFGKKLGVIITRGQPFHRGHLYVIEDALKENDFVLVVIGSADKKGSKRNPFSIEKRIYLFSKLKKYLGFSKNDARLQFITLDDWSEDTYIPYESAVGSNNDNYKSVSPDWGNWLYYNIVAHTGCKSFTLYYNDTKEIIDSWFPYYIQRRLTIKNSTRIGDYSSSLVRRALVSKDMDYLKNALPYLKEKDILALRKEIV